MATKFATIWEICAGFTISYDVWIKYNGEVFKAQKISRERDFYEKTLSFLYELQLLILVYFEIGNHSYFSFILPCDKQYLGPPWKKECIFRSASKYYLWWESRYNALENIISSISCLLHIIFSDSLFVKKTSICKKIKKICFISINIGVNSLDTTFVK